MIQIKFNPKNYFAKIGHSFLDKEGKLYFWKKLRYARIQLIEHENLYDPIIYNSMMQNLLEGLKEADCKYFYLIPQEVIKDYMKIDDNYTYIAALGA